VARQTSLALCQRTRVWRLKTLNQTKQLPIRPRVGGSSVWQLGIARRSSHGQPLLAVVKPSFHWHEASGGQSVGLFFRSQLPNLVSTGVKPVGDHEIRKRKVGIQIHVSNDRHSFNSTTFSSCVQPKCPTTLRTAQIAPSRTAASKILTSFGERRASVQWLSFCDQRHSTSVVNFLRSSPIGRQSPNWAIPTGDSEVC